MWRLAIIMLALMTSACGQSEASAPPCTPEPPAQERANVEEDVRLKVAMDRVAQLQRENAELRVNQGSVDVEMLQQEVASLKNALAIAAVANARPKDVTVKTGPAGSAKPAPAMATTPRKPTPAANSTAPETKRQSPRKPLTLDLR